MNPMIGLCIAVVIAIGALVFWVVRSRQRRRTLLQMQDPRVIAAEQRAEGKRR